MIKWGLKKIFYACLFAFIGSHVIALLILTFTGGAVTFFNVAALGTLLGLGLAIPLFIFHLLFWNILIKPGLIIAVLGPYIILRLLTRIFVIIPLEYLGAVAEGGISFFEKAEENIRASKRTYGAFFILMLLLCFYFFLPRDLSSFVSFITSATMISIVIFLIPTSITVLVAGLASKYGGGKEPVEEENNSRELKETAKAGFEVGKDATGLYKNLKDPATQKAVKNTANKAKGAAVTVGKTADKKVPKGLLNTIGKIPGIKRIVPWVAGTAGAEAVLALLVLLVFIAVIWVIVMLLFYLTIYMVFGQYVTGLMGFADGTLGLGMDYGQWAGQEIEGRAPNYDFTGERNALKMAWGRVQCAMSGPECLRQLQANNSERPGSESAGIKFGLEIEGFSLNDGYPFDISGRHKSDTIPVSFEVYNPVRNFKGIDAYNVQYRLTFDGGETCVANGGRDTWGEPLGEDIEQTKGPGGMIEKGGFDRPVGTLDDLTLENCGMLQPALGIYRDAKLQLLYDYSSQSTLQFKGMSENYMMEEGLRADPKESRTANTPVKTYVNVQSPVLFQDRNGIRTPDAVPVYVGFETGSFDIDYKVNIDELRFVSSSAMIDVDTAEDRYDRSFSGDCEDFVYEGNDVYSINLSSSSANNIQQQQENGWFSSGSGPSPFRCDMMLDPGEDGSTGPINSISPTGETLTARVDANYTVRLSSQGKNFEVTNQNRCAAGNLNCPLLVTHNETDGSTLRNSCDSSWRIQANSGCTVVENKEDWGNPEVFNEDNSYKSDIENRESAYTVSNLKNLIMSAPDSSSKTYFNENLYNEKAAVGVEKTMVEAKQSEDTFVVVNKGTQDNINAEIQDMNFKLCNSDKGREDEFVERASRNPPIFAQFETSSCKDIFGTEIFVNSCNNYDDAIRANYEGSIRCLR